MYKMKSLVLSLLLGVFVSTAFAGDVCPPSCPGVYIHWEGDCYRLFNTRKTWADAEKHCVADGGHLTSVVSAEENDFLFRLSLQGGGDDKHTWIGFNDLDKEGDFKWTDGSPITFKNWHSGEPNNYGKTGEDCAEINFFNTRGTWNDHFCTKQHPFICKKPASYE